jgi:hypothetical protein
MGGGGSRSEEDPSGRPRLRKAGHICTTLFPEDPWSAFPWGLQEPTILHWPWLGEVRLRRRCAQIRGIRPRSWLTR